MIGIYCIKNKKTEKEYVGQSIDIERRVKDHFLKSFYPNDSSYEGAIHRSIRKHGVENFEWRVLEECERTNLNKREKFYIEELGTMTPKGYNQDAGGGVDRELSGEIEKNHCVICGKEINKKSKRCVGCVTVEKNARKKLSGIEQSPTLQLDSGEVFIRGTLDDEDPVEIIIKCLDSSKDAVARSYGLVSGNSIIKFLRKKGYKTSNEDLFVFYEQRFGSVHPKKIEKERREKEKKEKENKPKIEARAVDQFSLDGTYIATHSSAYFAGKTTGVRNSNINEAVRGKRKTAGGFLWRYSSE